MGHRKSTAAPTPRLVSCADESLKPIIRVVAYLGGPKAVGRLLQVHENSVRHWLKRGICPPQHAIPLETASARWMTKEKLRPDVYPAGK